MALVFRELTRSRWPDFEALFEARGGPKSCWCMVWRATPAEAKKSDGRSRKAQMKLRVLDDVPVGILAYRGGEPVAWCSIAPKSTYRRLGGDDDEGVWSLACMYASRAVRGSGMTQQLVEAAIAHARKKGARIVEAYPVDDDSPSYRFMGRKRFFDDLGFEEVGRAGTRRHVMRRSVTRAPRSIR